MSRTNGVGHNESHVEQSDEFAAIERPPLRPSVEQEIQAQVDSNHPDVMGPTLEAEERIHARAWEIERTRARIDDRQDSDREARSRRTAGRKHSEQRRQFSKRAASADRWCDPDEPDPRTQLSRTELGEVNHLTARLAEKLDGWSRAAISRLVAAKIVRGASTENAVFEVFDDIRNGPGTLVPIAALGQLHRGNVSVEGTVVLLLKPSHPDVQQVGMLEDETGRTKFTIWRTANVPFVEEGDRVRLAHLGRSWYNGRVAVALHHRGTITVVEQKVVDG